MSRLIVSWDHLCVIVLISAIAMGGQYFVLNLVNDFSKVETNVSCTVIDFEHDAVCIRMRVDCAGAQYSVKSPEVVLSYFVNPGKLVCTIYKSGNATCKPREEVKKISKKN